MATVAGAAQLESETRGRKRCLDQPELLADDMLPFASPQRRRTSKREAMTPQTVGDVVGRRGTVVCRSRASLGDAADLMSLHDRTSTAIVDNEGKLLGALTENDILRAFASETPPKLDIDAWLKAQVGDGPGDRLPSVTLRSSASLSEAAKLMREHANADVSFRHLVVRDEVGALCGILSAFDLARALCSSCTDREVIRRTAWSTAAELMKPRSRLPVLGSSAPLSRALELMCTKRQNCVLVADGELAGPGDLVGLITPRDALRAFVEHVPTSVPVGHWLRGLRCPWVPRAVMLGEPTRQCAARMAQAAVHHLVVLSPVTGALAGVLSSTDLAQAVGSAERIVDGCTPSDR